MECLDKKGFTIMEAVLVLAIAGLIFLAVFIALPALSSVQRDAQRKNDSAIIASAVRSYMRNNHGNAPPDSGSVVSSNQFDENDERSEVSRRWENPNSSHVLDRYLGDELEAGGVTDGYTIANYATSPNITTAYWTIAGDQADYRNNMTGMVVVFVGALCPDLSEETKSYFKVDLTHLRTDVAIFRMLENGFWYCMNM